VKQIKLLPSRQVCIALAMALPFSLSMALAQERAKPGVTATEMQYQAGDSPLGKAEMHQNINPKAPADEQGGVRYRPRISTSSAAPAVTACCARAPPASR
jgi:hypothetical protein